MNMHFSNLIKNMQIRQFIEIPLKSGKQQWEDV